MHDQSAASPFGLWTYAVKRSVLVGLWRHQDRVHGKGLENSALRCDDFLQSFRPLLGAMANPAFSGASSGHEEILPCSFDPSRVFCMQVCGGALNCSHASCKARCGDCRSLQKVSGSSATHKSHAHGKELACGHLCQGDCESHVKDGFCPPDCSQPCPRARSHGRLRYLLASLVLGELSSTTLSVLVETDSAFVL